MHSEKEYLMYVVHCAYEREIATNSSGIFLLIENALRAFGCQNRIIDEVNVDEPYAGLSTK